MTYGRLSTFPCMGKGVKVACLVDKVSSCIHYRLWIPWLLRMRRTYCTNTGVATSMISITWALITTFFAKLLCKRLPICYKQNFILHGVSSILRGETRSTHWINNNYCHHTKYNCALNDFAMYTYVSLHEDILRLATLSSGDYNPWLN